MESMEAQVIDTGGNPVCGELDSISKIQWALLSGRLTARQLIDIQ